MENNPKQSQLVRDHVLRQFTIIRGVSFFGHATHNHLIPTGLQQRIGINKKGKQLNQIKAAHVHAIHFFTETYMLRELFL